MNNLPKKKPNKAQRAIKKIEKVVKVAERGGKVIKAGLQVAKQPYNPLSYVNLFKTIKGKGKYTVRSNSIAKQSTYGDELQLPEFQREGPGFRIKHSEFLTDVISSPTNGAFTVNAYNINPGLLQTFPWLNKIGRAFDQYTLHGIAFGFKSTSSMYNGQNQALGSVVMATEYNLYDNAPLSKYEMETWEFCVSGAPDVSYLHPIECDPIETAHRIKLCRAAGTNLPSYLGTTAPITDFDHGIFYMATQGVYANGTVGTTLGELWVTYDIEFFKPQAVIGPNLYMNTGLVTSNLGTYFFSTNPTPLSDSTFSVTFASTTITFPAYLFNQCFLVNCLWDGTGASVSNPTIGYTTNCKVGPVSAFGSVSGTQASYNWNFSVLLTGPNAVITLSGGTLPSAASATQIIMTEIPTS